MGQNIPSLPLSGYSEILLRVVFDERVDSSRLLFSLFELWQDFRLPAYLDEGRSASITWQLEALLGKFVEDVIASDA